MTIVPSRGFAETGSGAREWDDGLRYRRSKDSSDEGKVFNLVCGLQHEIDEDPVAAAAE